MTESTKYIVGLFIIVIMTVLMVSKGWTSNNINNVDTTTPAGTTGSTTPVVSVSNELFKNLEFSNYCNKSERLTLHRYNSSPGQNNELVVYSPENISPDGGGYGLSYFEIPFYEGSGGKSKHHFVIEVKYFDLSLNRYPVVIPDYISQDIYASTHVDSAPILTQNLSTSSIKVQHLETPEQVYIAFPKSDRNCINNFLREIDDLYLVTPIEQNAIDTFHDNGIVMQGEDAFYAPWGLYAAKYVQGRPYPIIMHFVYYADGGPFFKDKPYTIEDIMWSVRFGLKGEITSI